MFHRLRQICLVAQDLDPVVAELCDVFDVAVCHRDPEVFFPNDRVIEWDFKDRTSASPAPFVPSPCRTAIFWAGCK